MAETECISVSICGEGMAEIAIVEVQRTATISALVEEAHRRGLPRPDEEQAIAVFIDSGEFEIAHDVALIDLDSDDELLFILHRSREIEVGVTWEGQKHSRLFRPTTHVKEVAEWAVAEFRVMSDHGYGLARKGGLDLLDGYVPIGALHHSGECSLELTLLDEILIHNEDNGTEIKVGATNETLVSTVVDEVYTKFTLEPKKDDRLSCEGSGEDVFAFRAETLGKYLHSGHCLQLVWLFVGGTGGAHVS